MPSLQPLRRRSNTNSVKCKIPMHSGLRQQAFHTPSYRRQLSNVSNSSAGSPAPLLTPPTALATPPRQVLGVSPSNTHGRGTPLESTSKVTFAVESTAEKCRLGHHAISRSPQPPAKGSARPCAAASTQLDAVNWDLEEALTNLNHAHAKLTRAVGEQRQQISEPLRRIDSLPNNRIREEVEIVTDTDDEDVEIDTTGQPPQLTFPDGEGIVVASSQSVDVTPTSEPQALIDQNDSGSPDSPRSTTHHQQSSRCMPVSCVVC
jgi:hypothetical protein